MIVFDAEDLAPDERLDACDELIRELTGPCDIVHEGEDRDVRMRLDVTRYGPVSLVSGSGSGIEVVRTARHLRDVSRPTVSVTSQTTGRAVHVWGDERTLLGPSGVVMADRTRSQSYGWSGHAGARSLSVDSAGLGLSEDVVRAAIPRVPSSPLAALLVHHMGVLAAGAEQIAPAPGAHTLGQATLDMIRALIMSVAPDGPLRRSVSRQTLLSRVLAHTERHLTDPDLNAERIAAAHYVSTRTLYRVCGEAGISLEQEIITCRLRAVRRALEDPANRYRTIDAVARAHGFKDMTFFSRRFRLAFGVTPGEWRRGGVQAAA